MLKIDGGSEQVPRAIESKRVVGTKHVAAAGGDTAAAAAANREEDSLPVRVLIVLFIHLDYKM